MACLDLRTLILLTLECPLFLSDSQTELVSPVFQPDTSTCFHSLSLDSKLLKGGDSVLLISALLGPGAIAETE